MNTTQEALAVMAREDVTCVTPSGELVLQGHFAIRPGGLRIIDEPDFDDCAVFAGRLGVVEKSLQFCVGDFVNYCEGRWHEKAAQIIDHETFPESSVKVYAWVAKQVAPERRDARLTFKHHQLVAALNARDQKKWLEQAAAGDWPTSRLAQAIRAGADGPVVAVWLLVKCADLADLGDLRAQLEAKGRVTKVHEQRGRPKRKVEARARRSKKRSRRT